MSSALGRLRRHFDDELLTRCPEGMRPTPRAIAVEEPLRAALRQIRTLVSRGAGFDPVHATRAFTIALPDVAEVLFAPTLLAQSRADASGTRFDIRAFDRAGYARDLDNDRLDLVIGFGMGAMRWYTSYGRSRSPMTTPFDPEYRKATRLARASYLMSAVPSKPRFPKGALGPAMMQLGGDDERRSASGARQGDVERRKM